MSRATYLELRDAALAADLARRKSGVNFLNRQANSVSEKVHAVTRPQVSTPLVCRTADLTCHRTDIARCGSGWHTVRASLRSPVISPQTVAVLSIVLVDPSLTVTDRWSWRDFS